MQQHDAKVAHWPTVGGFLGEQGWKKEFSFLVYFRPLQLALALERQAASLVAVAALCLERTQPDADSINRPLSFFNFCLV